MVTYLIVFFLGVYLSLAAYHLLVYAGRRSDKNNLFYALLVLAFAYLTFTFSIIPRMTFIPERWLMLFWHLSILFAYLSVGASTFYYMVIILKLEKCRNVVGAYMVYNVAFFVLLFVASRMPGRTFREVSVWLFYLHMPVSTAILGYLFVSFLRRKDRTRRENQLALGIAFYATFFMGHGVLLMADVKEEIAAATINLGMIVTVFLFARLLAENFNREHHELIETKENLEERVKDRTEELVLANRLIEEQSTEKTAFFVNLAHETRTPATLIQNYLAKCLEKFPGDSDLLVVKRNVDKLVDDMVSFLDAEKIEQGRLSYAEQMRFDMSSYLADKVVLATVAAEKRGVRLVDEIKSHVWVTTSPAGLDRVLNNLVDNALRYTPKGGIITVGLAEADRGELLLRVGDTGVGIPVDKQAHVFEKYYQLSHTKGNTQGIGMGLFITKSIVENLGGRISFSSSPDGTTFEVVLPKGEGGEKMTPGEMPLGSNVLPAWRDDEMKNDLTGDFSETVLLVEDNIDLILSMREELGKEFNVLCAQNGRVALEVLEQFGPVDLVVSDVMMDEMNGYELLEELRKRSDARDVPFLFLTAKTGVQEEIKGLTSGAIDYVPKPFDVGSLRAKIRSLLDYQTLKRKAFEAEKYRSVGMLTAGVCHEIMNPLAGIKGPLFVIEESAREGQISDGSVFQEGIDHVKRNVQRIADIVGTMRSLFDGRMHAQDHVTLREVVEPVAAVVGDRAGERISMNVEIPEGLGVETNRGGLTQMITNLLSNAVEAIDGAGEIHVSASESDGVILLVRDNGVGIPEKDLSRIFDVSFTTKSEVGGSGLGLFIVKEIADRLGIRVSVVSKAGQGTEVSLLMPRAARKPAGEVSIRHASV